MTSSERFRWRAGLAAMAAFSAFIDLPGFSQGRSVRSTAAPAENGRMPVVAARPRSGKTALLLNGWSGYARDAQHSSQSSVQSDPLNRIHWQTPVDLQPQYTGSRLNVHYGSPLVTAQNTVIVPVKTGATDGFRVEARSGADGALKWALATDYILPPHNWLPVFGPVLTSASRLYFPGAGGTVYFRDQADSNTGAQGQIAFYGLSNYQANPSAYNDGVMINTPLTCDANGNIYFGFLVIGNTPLGLTSGIARISSSGAATWTSVVTAAGDTSLTRVVSNCAPALSPDGRMLYVAVSASSGGYLVALESATLAPLNRARLTDPKFGLDARLSNDGSASPTVGPDGDVYFGVLEVPSQSNHFRGWLLHFDSTLHPKTPGAFGWDDTASVVPASMVPSYGGSSSYLLMSKYNNYLSAGGDGLNKIAILDPNGTQLDPVTGAIVMTEVLTIAGPTPDGPPPAVREWCINSAVVDPATKSVLAGSEDGMLYRWDLTTNTLSQAVALTAGLVEAYTPTVIGVDGKVYAVNNAILFAVGK